VIEPRDVIVAVEGRAVASDGTVEVGSATRADLTHPVSLKQRGDSVRLTLVRAGKRREVTVALRSLVGECELVPPADRVGRPSFLVFAGFQIRRLTTDPQRLVVAAERLTRFAGEEAMVVCPPMADRVNDGYSSWYRLLETIDGVAVRNLRHAAELLDSGRGEYVVLGLAGGSEIVLDRALAAERHAGLIERYQVTADRSPDLARPANTRAYGVFFPQPVASLPMALNPVALRGSDLGSAVGP
jgi:hypothetical protein